MRVTTVEGSGTIQGVGTSDSPTFAGLTTTGDITAQNFIVSSSVTYMTQSFSSGSTIFGDTPADDTHQFTGSVSISGSSGLTINAGGFEVGSGNISGSATSTGSFGYGNVDTDLILG